jgi:hypothetical protein
MTTARSSLLNEQRLQRLSLWLALTVAWFVAHVLGRVAPHAAARILAQHARDARMLLVARAVTRVGIKRRRLPARIKGRRLSIRGVAGSALRRAFHQGPLEDRARALCAVFAEAERWIARIARRLKRGFAKLGCLPKPRRVRAPSCARAPLPARQVIDTT